MRGVGVVVPCGSSVVGVGTNWLLKVRICETGTLNLVVVYRKINPLKSLSNTDMLVSVRSVLNTILGQGICRCTNPNHTAYARYGGRGIIVCDRWRSFENFL